jgi:SAM-dependent methyltransferase
MRRNESFNHAAKLYDEVRPSYPDQVIDWIISKTGININDELLEIAPGTGQATKQFGKRGYDIHAVELGNNLAKLLVKNCKEYNVSVDVSSFEEWKSENTYNMIYCATAWHWLDDEIKYKKCHHLLKDNGHLVLIWNNAATSTNNKVMQKAFKLLFEYYPERPFSSKPVEKNVINEQTNATINEINQTGLFTFIDDIAHKWTLSQTKEITIKGFFSQSSYLSLSKEDKDELNQKLEIVFKDLEDVVDTAFITRAYIAKKSLT